MFTFAIPDTFDQSITFHNQNEPITGTVNAGIITGSPAMRDPSTDIVFVCNAMDVNSALGAWNGEVSDLRITYPPVGTFQLHVYGVIPDGQQYIFFCAPAGAPSLSPPVAGGGDGGNADSLGAGFVSGGGIGSIPDGTIAQGILGEGIITRVLFNAQSAFQEVNDTFRCFGLETKSNDGSLSAFIGMDEEALSSIKLIAQGLTNNSILHLNPDVAQISSLIIQIIVRSSGDGYIMIEPNSSFYIKDENQNGLQYYGDYSATLKNNPRSIPDVDTVNQLKKQPNVWTTAERPVPAGGEYPWGFNTTIGKHEGWNGTTWNSFY